MTRSPQRLGVAVLLTAAGLTLAGCGGDQDGSGDAHSPDAPSAAEQLAGVRAVVYRSPTCGCCENYEAYLRRHGADVDSEVTDAVDAIKADHDVPAEAESCHTTIIGDYAVEGHVPIEAIVPLLDSRPAIDGIAAPGMPANSPGMGEPDGRPLEIVAFADGTVSPHSEITGEPDTLSW
jgi:hypothetical protein